MPRIGVGLFILLVAVGLPGRGMAKSTASMSRGTQIFGEVDNLRADEQRPWLTAGELFTVDILPEISFFDSREQSYITVECIRIAEILDDAYGKSCPVIEMYPCEFEKVSFAPSESSIMYLFVMAPPYELMTGYYKMPLPKSAARLMTFGL
jgi:hypothetical protein